MTSPGLHDMSFADYERIEAINSHRVNLMARSPAHCRYDEAHPTEDTAAFRLGRAVHCAVLEPDTFASLYVPMPEFPGDPRTKAHKEARAIWEAQNADKAALKGYEYSQCLAIRDAVWAHPDAKRILSGKHRTEVTALWDDPGTGLLCKARIDCFSTVDGFSFVADLKTTKNASGWVFGQDLGRYGYHRQAAFYVRGLDILAPHDRRFVFIAVEKEPPYCVAVYEMPRDALMRAGDQVNDLVYLYAECKGKGEWPGYPVGIQTAQVPEWALMRSYDNGR